MTDRPLRPFTVFTFASTHDALGAEGVLRNAGVENRSIPAPKTGDEVLCGIGIRVPEAAAGRAREVLEAEGAPWHATLDVLDY